MKLFTSLFAAGLISVSLANDANAGLISLWNFNDAGVSGTSTPANTALLFSVDQGIGTMSTNIDTTPTPSTIVDFNGTTTNAQGTDPAGVALAIQNGTAGVNNGKFLQFNESTLGYQSIVVSFAIQGTATGFNSDQFQYTVDGTNYVNFGATFAPVLSFASGAGLMTFDLSSVTGLSNDANAGFRIVFNGGSTTSSSGNNRIDNLLVSGSTSMTAVPEPTSVILLGMGLVGALGIARRRRNRN